MSRSPLNPPETEPDSRLRDQLEITVMNEQDDYSIDVDRWLVLASDVLIAERVGASTAVGIELSVQYVNEDTITALNERFMGKSGPTDVLSFPMDLHMGSPAPAGPSRFDDDGFPVFDEGTEVDSRGRRDSRFDDENPDFDDAPLMLGDIVICPEVAFRNAALHGGERPEFPSAWSSHRGTLDDELALLLVHGILHLLGMDHVIDAEAEAMEEREREHLSRYYFPGTWSSVSGSVGDE